MPEATAQLAASNGSEPEHLTKSVEEPSEADLQKRQDAERTARGALSLLAVVILAAAYLVAFCARLFAVIRFESIIHEFDPW